MTEGPSRSFIPWDSLFGPTAFLKVPGKLSRPPPPAAGSVPGGFWSKFKIVREVKVSLDDVLHGRHLPPIGLKNFEQYLCFEERSPENLYFVLWFRDYKRSFQRWELSGASRRPGPELVRFFDQAKETFFSPASHLELNVTQESREAITNARFPPRPASLERIHEEVYEMLEESFGRFLKKSHFNMGRAYQLFAYTLGVFWICASFIPFITSHLFLEELPRRLIRIAGLLPLFFGLFVFDTARLGVCPIIYSLTDVASVRQVHPYELATQPPTPPGDDPMDILNRAQIALSRKGHDSWDPARPSDLESQLHPYPYQPHHHHLNSSTIDDEIEETFGPTDRLSAAFIHSYTTTTITPSQHSHSPSVATTATFVPSIIHGHEPKASTSSAIAPFAGGGFEGDATAKGEGGARLAFDFGALPTVTFRHAKDKKRILKNPNAKSKPTGDKGKAKTTTATFPAVPCFAPLTEVISPIILRLQWEILAKSLLLHFVIASVLTGILVALPTGPFKR